MEELKQLLFNDWVYTLIVLSTCTFYLLIAYGIYRCFRKPRTIEPKASVPSLQQLEELYGAPSDVIALSPTKCNQADSVILVYEDAGFLIADRDGRIVYREDKSSSYYPTLIDENFCVFYDWNSCKYIIRDYSGRELFSWIRPDQYEYW